MKPYEIIEHTADVGIKVFGRTLRELFEHAAAGMFAIVGGKENYIPEETLTSKKPIRIEKNIESFEELLVEFLSEILYISNKKKILFKKFNILELDKSGLIANAFGVEMDPSKYPFKTEIKAVTFHGLKIEKQEDGLTCTIIFDI